MPRAEGQTVTTTADVHVLQVIWCSFAVKVQLGLENPHTDTHTLYHIKQCLRYEIKGLDEGGRVV